MCVQNGRYFQRTYDGGVALDQDVSMDGKKAALEKEIKAAEAGDANAQEKLALDYLCGSIWCLLPYDPVLSSKWFLKAAEQGKKESQYAIGAAYSEGIGVKKDWGEAVKWFRKAAEQGHGGAYQALGGAYERGEGVKQSWEESYYWRKILADLVCSNRNVPPFVCDEAKSLAEKSAGHLTPEVKARTNKRAAEWIQSKH